MSSLRIAFLSHYIISRHFNTHPRGTSKSTGYWSYEEVLGNQQNSSSKIYENRAPDVAENGKVKMVKGLGSLARSKAGDFSWASAKAHDFKGNSFGALKRSSPA